MNTVVFCATLICAMATLVACQDSSPYHRNSVLLDREDNNQDNNNNNGGSNLQKAQVCVAHQVYVCNLTKPG